MGPKYKVTGCARFFVFLVIFIPAVFFGAAFIRGENGVQIIKDTYHKYFGGENTEAKEKAEEKIEETKNVETVQEELRKANEEIEALKLEIKKKDKEIETLKSGK